MLSLQLESDLALAAADLDGLADRGRADAPRPAAPYTRNPSEAAANAFDRRTGQPIDTASLKTLARSLVRYHLHSETKFLGGEDDAVGTLRRRHIKALAIQSIGKEADALEDRQFLGEGDADISYPLEGADFARLFAHAWSLQTQLGVSDRELATRARISHHTLAKLRRSGGSVEDATRLVQAMEAFRNERHEIARTEADTLKIAVAHAESLGGAAALAKRLGFSRQYVGRILKGERPVSHDFARKLHRLFGSG
jgi:transcriptional regulator with XRE-family HTH domain